MDKLIKFDKNISGFSGLCISGFCISGLCISFLVGYLLGHKIAFYESFDKAYIKASNDYYKQHSKYINIIEFLLYNKFQSILYKPNSEPNLEPNLEPNTEPKSKPDYDYLNMLYYLDNHN